MFRLLSIFILSLSLLSSFSVASVVHILDSSTFESFVIDSPTVVLALFLDLGKNVGDPIPPDVDLAQFSELEALVPGVSVALINYNVKDVSNEYNVRRRKASEGKWKSFVWGTRSRAAEQVVDFEGVLELSAAVNKMVEDKPFDGQGRRLKTVLALGAEPETDPASDL